MNDGPMGQENTLDDGWTYIFPSYQTWPDFRYRQMGLRVQTEYKRNAEDSWLNTGLFKDEDDMYAEIELSRAEPKND